MPKFEVGEIAIATGRGTPEECEIVDLAKRTGRYIIRVPGRPSSSKGGTWAIWEKNLRKKKPPEEKGSWERIRELTNWNPTKETADVL